MEDLFHGKSNHSPSQVQILVDGQLHYGALYEKNDSTDLIEETKEKEKGFTSSVLPQTITVS